MSKIGKQPITVPQGVDVTVSGSVVTAKGPKGTLTHEVLPSVTVVVEDSTVVIDPKRTDQQAVQEPAIWGMTRALISNMITGVSTGFEKILEFKGVGYRAQAKGNAIELNLGFSHPVTIDAPEGVTFETDKNSITIRGIDKEAIGHVAAKIRSLRKPEPYKGSGIWYQGEKLRKKAGKKAAATA